MTQGLGTILEARHLLLLATGEGKAQAVAAAVEGPGLRALDHYREVYEGKPTWQRPDA